jgi:hypothetical protein
MIGARYSRFIWGAGDSNMLPYICLLSCVTKGTVTGDFFQQSFGFTSSILNVYTVYKKRLSCQI